jgi:hypothetical protein
MLGGKVSWIRRSGGGGRFGRTDAEEEEGEQGDGVAAEFPAERPGRGGLLGGLHGVRRGVVWCGVLERVVLGFTWLLAALRGNATRRVGGWGSSGSTRNFPAHDRLYGALEARGVSASYLAAAIAIPVFFQIHPYFAFCGRGSWQGKMATPIIRRACMYGTKPPS